MAATLTELLDQSTTQSDPTFVTPSIAAIVVGRKGQVLYQHASGIGAEEGKALTPHHVFWLASQSKLLCTLASLIIVDRGLIGLDDDIANILPDLASLEVLDGGKDADGIPTTKPRQNKITLRLLLSHQSGIGYDVMPLSVAEWAKATNLGDSTLRSTQISMKRCPLAFEPGTGWGYGAGIDWAGVLIERLTKSTLEQFYTKNIWEPLGMVDSTFHPMKFEDRIVQPALRRPDGRITSSALPVPLEPPTETAGHGVWSSPSDYGKLLGVLLDGGLPILPRTLVDEIFKPQLKVPASILSEVHGIFKAVLGPSIPIGHRVDHGLAGLINLSGFPNRRPAGTLQWSGAPNLIWWIDRTTGIAATTFLQLMPPGDAKAVEFNIKFEEAVYKAFG